MTETLDIGPNILPISTEALTKIFHDWRVERDTAREEVYAKIKDGGDAVKLWSEYNWKYCNSTERANDLVELLNNVEINQQDFWKIINEWWSSFDRINHDAMGYWFGIMGIDAPEQYMGEENREFFETLPERVTVYRGQAAGANIGLSWTTDFEVAKAFAQGHRGHREQNPVVVEAKVWRDDIVAVFTDRNESEIVVFDTDELEIVKQHEIEPREG